MGRPFRDSPAALGSSLAESSDASPLRADPDISVASLRADHETSVALTRFTLPAVSLFGISLFETLIRVPALHLEPGPAADPSWFGVIVVAAFAAASFSAWTREAGYLLLPGWLVFTAIFCGFSGIFWYLWLGNSAFFLLHFAYAAAGGALFGLGMVIGARFLKLALAGALVERALRPVRLFLVVGGSIVLFLVLQTLGPLRAGAVLGALLGAASLGALGTLKRLEIGAIPLARAVPTCMLILLVVFLSSLWWLEAWIPARTLLAYQNTVLLYREGPRGNVALTAGEKQFQVFTNGLLRVSAVDERRYFESLVHPALALLPKRSRILLLGSGDGFGPREILRYPELRELWLLPESPDLLQLSRNVGWLQRRSERALLDPRIRVVGEEGLVWLQTNQQTFDAIIVDLADPRDPIVGKYYTRFCFQLLRDHLTPSGIIALQATAAKSPPQVLSDLVATSNAAGLTTLMYSAPVPTLGLWNFLLASPNREALSAVPRRLPDGLSYLDSTTLQALLEAARRETPKIRSGQVSLLHHQTILEAFLKSHAEP